MKKLLIFSYLLIQISLSSVVKANRVSGGSMQFGPHNVAPWFLDPQATITFCVEKDPNNKIFSFNIELLSNFIKAAFDFWMEEFTNLNLYAVPHINDLSGMLTPKTSTKHAIIKPLQYTLSYQPSCRTEVEPHGPHLSFIFGQKSLYAEHLKIVGDHQRYLAGAFSNSDYKAEQGYSEGFLFFTDHEAFKDATILKETIVHELGHVFGLGHMGDYIDNSVMTERSMDFSLLHHELKYAPLNCYNRFSKSGGIFRFKNNNTFMTDCFFGTSFHNTKSSQHPKRPIVYKIKFDLDFQHLDKTQLDFKYSDENDTSKGFNSLIWKKLGTFSAAKSQLLLKGYKTILPPSPLLQVFLKELKPEISKSYTDSLQTIFGGYPIFAEEYLLSGSFYSEANKLKMPMLLYLRPENHLEIIIEENGLLESFLKI